MLTYALNGEDEQPLYEQLYLHVRRDIEGGALEAGRKLPSKRTLARNLGVSVITVEGAYNQLLAEGYVYACERRGYYVAEIPGVGGSADEAPARSHDRRTAGAPGFLIAADDEDAAPLVADLTGSSAAQQAQFPYATWAKTMREVLSWGSAEALACEAVPAGSPTLRAAIADHVRAARGMEVDPACIVVGAGAQWLYNVLVQLLGRGLTYAVEDPGYPRLTSIYRANDVRLKHVPLDSEGICVDELRASGAHVAHVMPSHQYPTGVVTSVARRYELLGWAAQDPARVVIEDDYDCEFRLSGRPVPALKSVDATGSVVYLNTFAKSLGAAFRIGYMVLPPQLAARFGAELGFYSCTVSAADQLTLAALLQNGDYERHVNRMRARSRQVCADLVAALQASALAPRLSVRSQESGLHFMLGVEPGDGADDVALARLARAHGVALKPLSSFALGSGPTSGCTRSLDPDGPSSCWFVVDHAGLDRTAIPAVVQALEKAWA